MANVGRFGPLWHLRAEPNQFILHYKGGKVVKSGAGIAYFFNPLSAAVNRPGFHAPSGFCEPAGWSVTSSE